MDAGPPGVPSGRRTGSAPLAIKLVFGLTDIVGLILFPAGEKLHFATGQTMLADGGLSYF